LKLASETIAEFKADKDSSGNHDAGVLVKVSSADWAKSEPAGYDLSSSEATALDGYLGASKDNFPHVASNSYPAAQPMFEAAGEGDLPLGVTLRQTLAFDENGEKLLYYRQKLEDLYGVLPGEVVPVLTKGVITVASSACVDALESGPVYCGNSGKFTKVESNNKKVGTVIGIGDRNDQFAGADGNPDYFAGDGSTGAYYIINLDL
tara:strand:- start:13577 stop:14194 length:618 start_codon:yes stop_codon:yes gene_type:complete